MNTLLKVTRILQIEDDDDILEISRIAIELSPGVELHQARTGREGIEMMHVHRPEIVLLDVMMPDMDGPETLDHIRQSGFRSVPVIFLTARARAEDIDALKQMNVAGVINKPFDPLTIVDQIQRIVARAEAQV
jgi:CheY-like chemotaxis protein